MDSRHAMSGASEPVVMERYRNRSVEGTERKRVDARSRSSRWRKRNPEKYKAQQKRWRQKNRKRLNKYVAVWRKTHGSHAYRRLRLKRYGLTPERFDVLLREQGHRCAICRSERPSGRGTWHVDHDHVTREVRGLLCTRCNTGVGLFADNPARLAAAAEYLNRRRLPSLT